MLEDNHKQRAKIKKIKEEKDMEEIEMDVFFAFLEISEFGLKAIRKLSKDLVSPDPFYDIAYKTHPQKKWSTFILFYILLLTLLSPLCLADACLSIIYGPCKTGKIIKCV